MRVACRIYLRVDSAKLGHDEKPSSGGLEIPGLVGPYRPVRPHRPMACLRLEFSVFFFSLFY